jgi:hypothetical protein
MSEDEILSWSVDIIYAKYSATMLLAEEKSEIESHILSNILLKKLKKSGLFK